MGIILKSRKNEQLVNVQRKGPFPEADGTWREGESSLERRSGEK